MRTITALDDHKKLIIYTKKQKKQKNFKKVLQL